ncbi:TonB-dependent receptor [Mucilaginibacter sp. Bleaf8]|uniref:SusC/RagA family TonB-linked outer membrane protein n=1 Tax=Mucilaginibacter sp. Bleaf8 TaxID=2834430 RepID=UPI001BCC6C82|nr:TonB-dependent receptor [Mucilaginibacter sp. Bleaf8]MBS7563270.1 TonB-dependent receptor [Mucilaginibacter sp. Bleaf8]
MEKKVRLLKLIVFLFATLCISAVHTASYAQSKRKITGTVLSATDSQPLPGVAVRVSGGTAGAATDANGAFSIEAKTGDVLTFSFIGFQPKNLTVGEGSTVRVALTEESKGLNEVVVVGYGTQVKKLVTGATVHVGGESLTQNHNLQVEQALQGQTPGVQITSTSGQPGEALKVRIRGIGTTGTSDPLYVVDGVQTTDISYLNSADIESVDVLKDAASAAIYGTRAANGVILITTRKGKSGASRVSVDGYYGIQNMAKKLPMLNSKEYAVIMNEAAINSGSAPYFTTGQINQLGTGTDWQDAVRNENAPTQNYTINVSGGNDKSTYSTSASYQSQVGIIGPNDESKFERITYRLSTSTKLYKDVIRIGEDITFSHSKRRGLSVGNIYANSLRGVFNTSPLFPVYNADGTYAKSSFNNEEANPVALMEYQSYNKRVTDRLVGSAYVEANFLKYFKFRSALSLDLAYPSTNSFTPLYNLATNVYTAYNSAYYQTDKNTSYNWDNTLTYDRLFGKHKVSALLGTTTMEQTYHTFYATKQNLTIPDFEHAELVNGTTLGAATSVSSNRTPYALQSYFGRVNYSYNDKYLFTAILRRDGSSHFGQNNKYANFPSLSGGWVISSEDFMKSSKWLDFFKIRAGWGKNGNDRIIDPFAYLATVSAINKDYYFGNTELKAIGASPDRLANPNLRWEASEQTDIGFDATIFRDFTINFDWYNKTTKDWLLVAPIPAIVGTGAPYINGGAVSNKGVEFAAAFNHKYGDFNIGINGNISFNKNRVTEIANSEGIIHGNTNVFFVGMDEMYRAEVGHPIGYFYGLKTNGVFQNDAEVQSYNKGGALIQPGAVPGDVRFIDLNNDGKIDQNDKTQIGDPNPHYTYGGSINMGYKGFDFAVSVYGVGGNQIANGVRAYDRPRNNYTTDILERWHGEGTSNRLPRVTLNNEPNQNYARFSDLYIENGAFLRIKSVNLGYDFKRLLPPSFPLQQLRLYVSATNLYTFTKYSGLDPEVGYGDQTWASGTDLGYYPQPRTYILGLSVKF